MSLPDSLAVIDVETTGANPVDDRITEIGILRIEHGEIAESWSTLVNPLIPIPPKIQAFTGISDAMVATAPTFAELAGSVRARLQNAVFAAHNARFDYAFIRNEFARLEQNFAAPVLCTVKLSRALFPEHPRHGLDALIARHGLHCPARHRALGDAEALWSFLQLVRRSFPAERLQAALERAMKNPPRPAGLPDGMLEAVPPEPGVYLLFGEHEGAPERLLLVGHGADLRSRVAAHFAPGRKAGRDAELARRVRRIETLPTAGELGARLLEVRVLRERQPCYGGLPAGGQSHALRLLPHRRKPPVVEWIGLDGSDPRDWDPPPCGGFRDRREGESALRKLAQIHRLCPLRLGLEAPSGGPCSAFRNRHCAGVCAGLEKPATHDARLAGALGALQLKAWPWPGAVGIPEQHGDSGRSTVHVVDHWCLLGTAGGPDELARLLELRPQRRFDLDDFRILARWLAVAANRAQVRVFD